MSDAGRACSARDIVLEFYRRVVWDGDIDAAGHLAATDVVVHAPRPGRGHDALAESVREMFVPAAGRGSTPRPAAMPAPVLTVTDGDIVVVAFYLPQVTASEEDAFDYFSFDAFRVRDGLLVERWPSVNRAAPTQLNWTEWPASPGSGPDLDTDPAAAKQLAVDFYRHVFDAQDAGAIRGYVAEDYQQHARHMPKGRPGLEGLVGMLFPDGPRPMPETMSLPNEILVAEAGVVVQAGLIPQPDPDDPTGRYPYYVYDAFGVRDGKLAEHWSGINKAAPPQHG